MNGFGGGPFAIVAFVQMLQVDTIIDIEFAVQWIYHSTHCIGALPAKLGQFHFEILAKVLTNAFFNGVTRFPERFLFPRGQRNAIMKCCEFTV